MNPGKIPSIVMYCFLLYGLLPASAEISQKQSFLPPMSMGSTVFECDSSHPFLIGLTENKTDRIVGVTYVCAAAAPGGVWKAVDSAVVPVTRIGDLKHGTGRNTTCPHNFFLIGFTAMIGNYSADTHGIGSASPQDLLADLAPICRDRDGAIFSFDSGHNDQAGNNHLQTIPWDGLSGARTCGVGQAAIGIAFNYQEKPGLDPNNRFYDAALLCDQLPINVPGIGGAVIHEPPPGHPHPPR